MNVEFKEGQWYCFYVDNIRCFGVGIIHETNELISFVMANGMQGVEFFALIINPFPLFFKDEEKEQKKEYKPIGFILGEA